MPYTITTYRRDTYELTEDGQLGNITPGRATRRAVATLDEAREAAYAALAANDTDPAPHFDAHFTVDSMTGEGGTVGPLPDGTVIQVERTP